MKTRSAYLSRGANSNVARSQSKTEKKTRDERWDELQRAAARVFAKKGYKSTSLQELADEIGILKGSLYYYIDTKEDLLYEIVRGVLDGGMNNLQRIASEKGDAVTRLKKVVNAHVQYLIGNLAATTVFLHDIKHLSKARRDTLAVDEYEIIIQRLIEEGQAEGSVRTDIDAKMIEMAVLGVVNWTYRWYRADLHLSAERIGQQFAELISEGLTGKDSRT